MDDPKKTNPNDDRAKRLYAAKTISLFDHDVDPSSIVRAFFPTHAPASHETGVSIDRRQTGLPFPAVRR